MSVSEDNSMLRALLAMSHELGDAARQLAILGEGNTSIKLSADTFLVKASGSQLAQLTPNDIVECRFDTLLPLLTDTEMSDAMIDQALFDSRVNPQAPKPSVEAIFHAYLLNLPGIEAVGHTHPTAINAILCSPKAEAFANNRLFPDEVVCCGPASVLVPYTDPGRSLAKAIAMKTQEFIERWNREPRVILLKNHGLIAIGSTPSAISAATHMTVKAAEIFSTASLLGGPDCLTTEQIERIASRPDEHYRQKVLNL